MTKDEIFWLKKIVTIDSDIQNLIKKSVSLSVIKDNTNYKIEFKIISYSYPIIFNYLEEIFNKLKDSFSITFSTTSNNFNAMKNCIDVFFCLNNTSNFDIYKKNGKYYVECLNLDIYNKLNSDNALRKFNILGLYNSNDFLLYSSEKEKDYNEIKKEKEIDFPNFPNYLLHANSISSQHTKLKDVILPTNKEKNFIIIGEIFEVSEDFYSKSNFRSFKFNITDYDKSITLKYVMSAKNADSKLNLNKEYLKLFSKGLWIKADITLHEDNFEHGDLVGYINKITPIKKPKEFIDLDEEEQKRIELNMHTNMSAFDGVNSPEQIILGLKEKGLSTISINDFNSVQSFPTIYRLSKKNNIDLIYGAEFTFANKLDAIYNATHYKIDLNTRFVFFDLETTGLSPNYDEIMEFGAYITDMHGNKIDSIQQFISINSELNEKTTNLTRITKEDLKNQPTIKEFLKILHTIIQPNDILVAHNGIDFDIKFLNAWCRKCGLEEFKNPLIDTLVLSRAYLVKLGYHTLGRISRYFSLEYDDSRAHRANVDALYLNNIFWKLIDFIPNWESDYLDNINRNTSMQENLYKKSYFNRIILQARYKDYDGISSIKKLYEIISIVHTKDYNDKPLLYKEVLNKFRNWFLVSNSPVDGDLIEIGLKEDDETIINWMKYFDYIQISPLESYRHLFPVYGEKTIKNLLAHIIELSKKHNIKLVATSNGFYMHKYQQPFHKIYILTKSLGGKRHRYLNLKEDPLNNFTPDLHVRNTKEMLDEFLEIFNDKNYINEIVVKNSNDIYNMFDHNLVPIQTGLFPPQIEGVEEKLKTNVYENAKKQYGDNLPNFIKERLEFELDIIIKNGYSVVYWISHLLVTQSLNDGFLVGSRGSVGSSLVATFLNITEINPLHAHYYCKKCHYFELVEDYSGSGYDLKKKHCPNCDELLIGDGQNIPFATFLGFDGDKIPDIDLNFSGLYQANAHNFIKQMFGEQNAFRAGTIGTVAEKTAYAYVKEFLTQLDIENDYSNAQIRWLVLNCMNVKRTTGQHPGGIVVVPQNKSVYDFTPYNYPADDTNLDWYTTHFAFEDIHDNILKFDILGHDDPTILKYLKDLTGIDPRDIPTSDENVISLFTNTKSIKIKNDVIKYSEKNAAIGLPEFGTKFVREMLNETKPKTFSDLIRISGLSHGTDVWANNAQILVKEGKQLTDLVTCRDDIMTNLSSLGIKPLDAFRIMEDIRKGKGLKPDDEKLLREKNIPDWYINSCKKIVYLFPKAHAAAYVLTAWRIAWFKVYYPLEYYSTYFSVRCDVFDINSMKNGTKAIYDRLKDIQTRRNDKKLSVDVSKKEIDLISVLEVALEMSLRGLNITNIDLKKSDSTKFIIDYEKNSLIPPFIVIDGLGEAVANSIVEARNKHEFVSIQDFKERTKVNKTHIKILEDLDVFKDMNESNQLTFDF